MRLFLLMLSIICLLAGCGTDKEMEKGKSDLASIELVPLSESEMDGFTLRLKSEKERYKEGEPLDIVAELTYRGKEDIVIGHGGSWVALSTTNVSKDYQFGSAMDEPYIIRQMSSGDIITDTYSFSGGTYHEGKPGNPYSFEEFKRMAEDDFPPGIYKIEAVTDFVIDGEEKRYNLKGEIIFEVVEE